MIRRFRVRNFKSYRDAEFEFGKVNVVVGPNGSGKTNLVDAFSALKQLVRPVSLPPFPFAKWGDYRNAVFMQDENLDVSFELDGTYKDKEYHYEVSLDGTRVKREVVKYGSYTVEREGETVRFEGKEAIVPPNLSVFNLFMRQGAIVAVALPFSFPQDLLEFVLNFMSDVGVFRIVPQLALSPVHFTHPDVVYEDGRGIVKVLASNLAKVYEGKGTEVLRDFLDENNVALRPYFTEDGNVRLQFLERADGRELVLPPSSVPDGLIKMLVLLTAVYVMGLSTLVVDEVESSLHLRYIEKLVDVMRYSGAQFIVTTHSPLVIDFMDPSEIIVLEKEKGETKVKRIEEPGRLREELVKSGLLLSEWLLY